MASFTEAPYIAALKESCLTSRCSTCFNPASEKCPECHTVTYCNEQCRMLDRYLHNFECQAYQNCSQRHQLSESVLARMIARVITRLKLDGGKPEIDLCSNVPNSIQRRSWTDLLSHREDIPQSERHRQDWLMTKKQVELLFGDQFDDFDLLEIYGKLVINRFRVGFFKNMIDGRIAVGWAIYLTTSLFNHSCEPDLLQCSYDINMRLKFSNTKEKIPETTAEFNRLTVSYRHQNDFRLTNPLSYVPTRAQRQKFVSFFFFNCHCVLCADDLSNRYAESSTNRLCDQCGEPLVLQTNFPDSTVSVLTCIGRKNCPNIDRILDRVVMPTIDEIKLPICEKSIAIYEKKLRQVERLMHPESITLLQQREKLFFTYQHLINQHDLIQHPRTTLVHRAIELGELLLQGYHVHLKQSAVYPKIVVNDVAALYEINGQKDKATKLYRKMIHLWRSDYEDRVIFDDLKVKT